MARVHLDWDDNGARGISVRSLGPGKRNSEETPAVLMVVSDRRLYDDGVLPQPGPEGPGPRRSNLVGIVATALGLVLFAWFVSKVGLGEIWSGLAQVGWGLVAIIALAGLRFAMRATAWTLCLEPPHRLPFRAAFAAVVAGDAIGNLTPLGIFASEPAKAAFVRDRVPLGPALTALAIENIFYILSVGGDDRLSTAALVLEFSLPPAVQHAAWVSLVAIAGGFVIGAAPVEAAGPRHAGVVPRDSQRLTASGPRRAAA